MEEDVKTELYLSEEQLQAITGGCGQCDVDNKEIATYGRQANGHRALHQIALETGFPNTAQAHLLKAIEPSIMAEALRRDIMERHQTPGGNTAPGESSGSALAKRQRM